MAACVEGVTAGLAKGVAAEGRGGTAPGAAGIGRAAKGCAVGEPPIVGATPEGRGGNAGADVLGGTAGAAGAAGATAGATGGAAGRWAVGGAAGAWADDTG